MLKRTPDAPAERVINGGGRHRRYVFFAVASLALFMSPGSATAVATALPAIKRGLQADLVWPAPFEQRGHRTKTRKNRRHLLIARHVPADRGGFGDHPDPAHFICLPG